MTIEATISFFKHFEALPAPRQSWKIKYPLGEILLLVLCAVISGAEGFKDIVLYGQQKLSFLRQFSLFSKGVPSEDTLGELFANLNPRVFQECFVKWVQSFPAILILAKERVLRRIRAFEEACLWA